HVVRILLLLLLVHITLALGIAQIRLLLCTRAGLGGRRAFPFFVSSAAPGQPSAGSGGAGGSRPRAVIGHAAAIARTGTIARPQRAFAHDGETKAEAQDKKDSFAPFHSAPRPCIPVCSL